MLCIRFVHSLATLNELQLPFPGIDRLKESKIGRQCMFLYKHVQETADNKKLLWKLIDKWARPIHGRVDSYAALKPEERERLDVEAAAQLPRRRLSSARTDQDDNLRFICRVISWWVYFWMRDLRQRPAHLMI